MRLVYCPTEEMLEEAELLAKTCGVPIVVGDNAFTSSLDFDRTIVQIVSSPEKDELKYLPKSTVSMCHVVMFHSVNTLDLSESVCLYTHDDISNVFLTSYNIEFTPYLCEKNYVRFHNRLPCTGLWRFRINLNGNDLAYGEVNVHEDGRYRTTGARNISI